MDDFHETDAEIPLARGAALIRRLAGALPDTPGVYRMIDEKGQALYVGKAKSLKKRVITYARPDRLPVRLQRMVAQTRDMAFVHTHTEVEALLLETNLIKTMEPRYNILMRDDKSFPYIFLTGDHDFPLLTKHRGAQKRKGDYYGPFASGDAVNRTIAALQKAFMLRNCADSVFAARTRPCLQYHIKRCTAPCTGLVDKAGYAAQVRQAKAFLSGKSAQMQEELAAKMQAASDAQDYESAAAFRDRIKALSAIQTHQDINVKNLGDADVMGLYTNGAKSCIQVFFFRAGQNFGNRAFFPRHDPGETPEAILEAFIAQFYEERPVPPEIILTHKLPGKALLEEAFALRAEGRAKPRLIAPQGGVRKRLADFAAGNARDALAREEERLAGDRQMLEKLASLFGLEGAPSRIEVYDNSHISGTNMVGAMIVAGPEGFRKTAYRKFNIKQAAESDDYGMMREVMTRRFASALKEGNGPCTETWPALVLIDGGQGQLASVMQALDDLGIADSLSVAAIAKGPDRHAGREKFFLPGKAMFQLPVNDPLLHYLQRLRDEAHRFAIGAHRARRAAALSRSPLDDVPGIGPARKKALLRHFGSAEAVAGAAIGDLARAPGISRAMAEKLYAWFHER